MKLLVVDSWNEDAEAIRAAVESAGGRIVGVDRVRGCNNHEVRVEGATFDDVWAAMQEKR